ncbi:MFS transporter [Kitasatospora sp. SUK 42]|uniref:MFS transporter n=1 Tax=Kitasatospora sp. SUK 42 TaxID=1588882 RepID=UPI0018CB1DD8|nr:MFS transporter [Kitasatospora sp. SUK 42]MBV2155797.1 MFS transporter [Kitasatospora sp. SUK 42]
MGAFALGTSENVVAGILPNIAHGLGVTEGSAGLLVTAYAATVTVAGPLLTLFLDGARTKRLLLWSLVVYLAGSVLAATATTFAVGLAARVLTGLVHTTVLVVFMTTAMRLARPGKQASAAAGITLGLSLATVLGVPIGVLLGQHVGWQAAFALVAVLSAISLGAVALTFPPDEAPAERASGNRSAGLRGLGRAPLLLGVAVTALTGMAALTLVTYVAPFLTDGAGLDRSLIVWVMLVYGIGSVVGNTAGGRLANRNVVRAMAITVTATLVVLAGLAIGATSTPVAVVLTVLVGLAYFSTFPALNTWVATNAGEVSPILALSVNSSAFNVGIALAGAVGGAYLDGGRPAEGLPLPALVPAVAAAALAWVLFARYGRARTTPPPAANDAEPPVEEPARSR